MPITIYWIKISKKFFVFELKKKKKVYFCLVPNQQNESYFKSFTPLLSPNINELNVNFKVDKQSTINSDMSGLNSFNNFSKTIFL